VAFQEGTANYFKGLMLILCYLIVAASFFVHVDPTTSKCLLFVFYLQDNSLLLLPECSFFIYDRKLE
jgi:hypothetical protein